MNAQVNSSDNAHAAFERNKRALAEAIEENHTRLLGGIRALVWKMSIADIPTTVDMIAHEIFNETVVVALDNANRYDPTKPAHSWLLGIAANKIKEHMRKTSNRERKTPSVIDVHASNQNTQTTDFTQELTEEDMIDSLLYSSSDNHLWQDQINISFDELISLVSKADKLVLSLAFINNLKGKDLAATLGISEGAAYVRLSRAISRLREAYKSNESLEEKLDVK